MQSIQIRQSKYSYLVRQDFYVNPQDCSFLIRIRPKTYTLIQEIWTDSYGLARLELHTAGSNPQATPPQQRYHGSNSSGGSRQQQQRWLAAAEMAAHGNNRLHGTTAVGTVTVGFLLILGLAPAVTSSSTSRESYWRGRGGRTAMKQKPPGQQQLRFSEEQWRRSFLCHVMCILPPHHQRCYIRVSLCQIIHSYVCKLFDDVWHVTNDKIFLFENLKANYSIMFGKSHDKFS